MKSEFADTTDIDGMNGFGDPVEPDTKLTKSTKSMQRSGGRRTHRACDRCRVKKSKCNGQQPCNTCKANERTCVFSALRRRDIRKWHCHMQDTVDEAIQRLYKACKESASFPGTLPDEKDGYVTTESILLGMGFTNLDLGPRASAFTPNIPLQSLPLRTHYNNMAREPGLPHASAAHHEANIYLNNHSDTSSDRSAASTGSPHTHDQFNMSPIMPGHFDQQAVVMPLLVTNQIREAVESSIHHPQHYHHHSFPSPLMTQQPQGPHFRPNEQRDSAAHIRGQLVSPPGSDRVQYPYQFREIYPPPAYYSGPFISPQQVWPGHNDMMTVSQ